MDWSEAEAALEGSRSGSRWRSVFQSRTQTIFDGYEQRHASPPIRRVESANAWFKREAYPLLSYYIDKDMSRVFEMAARRDARSHSSIAEVSKNPFKLGLLAMFSNDLILSRGNRHVFGNQMLYAWAHAVPHDFLNAFLAVTGSQTDIVRRLKTRTPEAGFERRFIASRLNCLD